MSDLEKLSGDLSAAISEHLVKCGQAERHMRLALVALNNLSMTPSERIHVAALRLAEGLGRLPARPTHQQPGDGEKP